MTGAARLLLVRHGETDWNAERRLRGFVDIPLNAEGMRQAAAVAAALSGEEVHAVYASDLARALSTAQAVAGLRGMPVTIDPALRERSYGDFEGLTPAEIGVRYPADYAAWLAREPDVRYSSLKTRAETLREFSDRAVGAVIALAQQAAASEPRTVIVVTHGGVLDCLYRHILPAPADGAQPAGFSIPNASIHRLLWDGASLHIQQWGDVSHLAPLAHAALDELEAGR